jgi:hypothetical protein
LDGVPELLAPLDHQGLLAGPQRRYPQTTRTMDDDALLAELEGAAGTSDITDLRHVRTAPKSAPPRRSPTAKCEDFDTFKPLFEQVQRELDSGGDQKIP